MDIEFREAKTPEIQGLKDLGHHYISCSNCNAMLLDIWVTQEIEKFSRIQASCPFCGDQSFVAEVKGKFHAGGIGETDDDDARLLTVIHDALSESNKTVFVMRKGFKDAKPRTK